MFRKPIYRMLLATAMVFVLAACSQGGMSDLSKNADGYTDITVQQLKTFMDEKEGLTLVNVHIPYEGEIPETNLMIPYDQIADHLDQLPGKDAPIVLYCRSGNMSTTAAKTLAELGYTRVYEVDGGFNAWKAAGYELITR